MENQASMFFWLLGATVIFSVIGLFNYYSKKYHSIWTLIGITLLPSWAIAALMMGLINLATNGIPLLLSIRGIPILFAMSLPITLPFGLITFFFKYRKFKKGGLKQYEKDSKEYHDRANHRDKYDDIIDEIGKKEEK